MSAVPPPYDRQANFVSDAGNNPLAGPSPTKLDAEFNAIETALDATQSRLAEIQRDDGQLRNGIVTDAALDPAIVFPGNRISQNSITSYHLQDGSVGTNELVDGSVTVDKIANNSITAAKIVDGSIAIGDIAGLQTALNSKQASGSYVTTSDSRLTDSRTPTLHKSTHASGGTDALSPSDIGAAPVSHSHGIADVTDLSTQLTSLSTAISGKQPVGSYLTDAPNDGTPYARKSGTWAAISTIVGPQGPVGPVGPKGDTGFPGADGPAGSNGSDGATAYEIAVANGFAGDEAAWLASLVGPQGPEGPQGPQGDGGANGADGPSAYVVALNNGFAGDEAAWLASLVGPQGPEGPQGPQGPEGPQGIAGESAYQVALTNGFFGSESSWLASLVGPEGPQGPAGSFDQSLNTSDEVSFSAINSSYTVTDFLTCNSLSVNGSSVALLTETQTLTNKTLTAPVISNGSTSAILTADASNILAQRNGVNAQSLRVYGTYTDASNYERGVFDWSTNSGQLTIGTQKAGSGQNRVTRIQASGQVDIYPFDLQSVRFSAATTLFYIPIEWAYYSAATDPTTANIGSGRCAIYRNTTSGAVKLWVNAAGTMRSVTLS